MSREGILRRETASSLVYEDDIQRAHSSKSWLGFVWPFKLKYFRAIYLPPNESAPLVPLINIKRRSRMGSTIAISNPKAADKQIETREEATNRNRFKFAILPRPVAEQGIVYSASDFSARLRKDRDKMITKVPVMVHMAPGLADLPPTACVHYGQQELLSYDVESKDIGMVAESDIPSLLANQAEEIRELEPTNVEMTGTLSVADVENSIGLPLQDEMNLSLRNKARQRNRVRRWLTTVMSLALPQRFYV
ncbi:hypothetical protein CC86DRAFT_416237 [Ophiobolus disseminans]|uniref:DUF6590 domain-containing protein n=1 Tax=Ophiobolus disseminans TaxID=1469910 RepID=A0A6A7A200_9PLEO|nr:hypothetical protein CC86DRAFT_416237 [Ophiobolus disseminans]